MDEEKQEIQNTKEIKELKALIKETKTDIKIIPDKIKHLSSKIKKLENISKRAIANENRELFIGFSDYVYRVRRNVLTITFIAMLYILSGDNIEQFTIFGIGVEIKLPIIVDIFLSVLLAYHSILFLFYVIEKHKEYNFKRNIQVALSMGKVGTNKPQQDDAYLNLDKDYYNLNNFRYWRWTILDCFVPLIFSLVTLIAFIARFLN